jgi:uncharacterized membrane protein
VSDHSDDFQGKDLRGAGLSGANLQNQDLSGADLRNANLSGANLQKSSLKDADLRNANLKGANLADADLRGAELEGAALDGANLSDARMSDDASSDSTGELTGLVSSVVSGLTIVVAFSLLALGYSNFWVVFIIGFAAVMPLSTKMASWYESRSTDDAESSSTESAEEQDALTRLRERYATGDIDEEEFERRVERLLETESVDDAETFYHGSENRDTSKEKSDREREPERN